MPGYRFRYGLALLLVLPGCGGRDTIRIGTNLPDAICELLEQEISAGSSLFRVTWVHVEDGRTPVDLLRNGAAVDLVLGGALIDYARPENQARMEPGWFRSIRWKGMGVAVNPAVFASRALHEPQSWDMLGDARVAGLVGLGDPRQDPTTLTFCRARLREGRWQDGYAALVLAAGNAAPISRGRNGPWVQFLREEVGLAPVIAETLPDGANFLPAPDTVEAREGLAVVRGSRHLKEARAIVERLDSLSRTGVEALEPRPADAALADLLGAVLVDAQNELVLARSALERMPAGPVRSKLERDLIEAPPWPPASVQILSEPGLVEALAEQIAPGLESRYWLLQSWEKPPRPIDATVLDALVTASAGKLWAEPRFRAWLRAEWSTWSRQRYRRVARWAEAHVHSSDGGTGGTSPSLTNR